MQGTTDLAGRVVVITGGGRGIGLATARALHRAGGRVAIGDIDQTAAAEAAQSIAQDVLGGAVDVSDAASFAAFLALVEREVGPIDVLVNNAGIMPIGGFVAEPETTARRVFDVNVHGCMNGMKLALPPMLKRRRGHIVNVASMAGKSPVPGGASYCASKAAIIALTETVRIEYSGQGVDFTCVLPSFTATDLISGTKGVRFMKAAQPEDVADAIVKAIESPRADAYVPAVLGVVLRIQDIAGRQVRDVINRVLGVNRAFLDIDPAGRAAYDMRITGADRTDAADVRAKAKG